MADRGRGSVLSGIRNKGKPPLSFVSHSFSSIVQVYVQGVSYVTSGDTKSREKTSRNGFHFREKIGFEYLSSIRLNLDSGCDRKE